MEQESITYVAHLTCAGCGSARHVIAMTTHAHQAPAPGDVYACLWCGFPMVLFDALGIGRLCLRPLPAEEYDRLEDATQREVSRIAAFARARLAFRARKG